MAPIFDVLSILKPETYVFRGLDAVGQWSLRYPAMQGVRCYMILSGTCWLVVDEIDESLHLMAGDCVLLTTTVSLRLTTNVAFASEINAVELFSGTGEGGVATIHGEGKTIGLFGAVVIDRLHA